MAQITGKPTVTAYLTIELSESEAAALDALTCYSTEDFIEFFYKHMGKSYLQPHEMGLRSLFASIRKGDTGIRAFLKRAKQAREVFTKVEAG